MYTPLVVYLKCNPMQHELHSIHRVIFLEICHSKIELVSMGYTDGSLHNAMSALFALA